MGVYESFGDIDVVWTDEKPQTEKSAAILFNQSEMGHATIVSGMCVIDDAEPIGRIYSRYFAVEPFNHIPHVLEPCWLIYEKTDEEGERNFIIRMNHWMPPSDFSDVTNWLWAYPLCRDIVVMLCSLGVEQLFLLSSLVEEDTTIPMITYDFHTEKGVGLSDDRDLALTSPCWMIPELFSKIQSDKEQHISMLLCVKSNSVGIDEDAVQHLLEFYGSIGLDHNPRAADQHRLVLNSIDEDGSLNTPFYDENDSGGYHI